MGTCCAVPYTSLVEVCTRRCTSAFRLASSTFRAPATGGEYRALVLARHVLDTDLIIGGDIALQSVTDDLGEPAWRETTSGTLGRDVIARQDRPGSQIARGDDAPAAYQAHLKLARGRRLHTVPEAKPYPAQHIDELSEVPGHHRTTTVRSGV